MEIWSSGNIYQTTHVVGSGDIMHIQENAAFDEEWAIFHILIKDPWHPDEKWEIGKLYSSIIIATPGHAQNTEDPHPVLSNFCILNNAQLDLFGENAACVSL